MLPNLSPITDVETHLCQHKQKVRKEKLEWIRRLKERGIHYKDKQFEKEPKIWVIHKADNM